ncbi:restriction endonuclease subunit S [Enterococcus casseliflavus]|uniref:restriction endonuclease subunit S n=1 Tax=Enterococcus casseliflavus TaxID=37734 RepID=UPI00132FC5CD|nr:restriction endonuclease subunit S [Enterococcus casseliflavus]
MKYRLSELANIRNGKKPKTKKLNAKYEIYGSNGIIGYTDKSNSGKNTIVIGRVGANAGSVLFSENESWVSDNAIIVTPKDDSIAYYLYYLLKKSSLNKFVSGSAQPLINQSILNSIHLRLIGKESQLKVAQFLRKLDSKIELNNQIISNLEELASTLFKRWFVDFEFPDENGNPYKSSGGKMIDSELGEIPDGWRLSEIGEEVQIVRGASPRPIQEFMSDSSGRPWVKISDANSASSCFINRTKQFIIDKGISRSRTVEPGTLILSNSATPGIPKFMDILASVHDGWLIFNDYRSFSKEFLYLLLLNKRKSILSLSNGSVFRNLKTDILKKFPVVVPNEIILRKAQILYENIFKIILHHSREITTLEQLRDSLLPKLLSGEIELPEDEEV